MPPPSPVPGVDAPRVLVPGISGAGKSTPARRLARVAYAQYVERTQCA